MESRAHGVPIYEKTEFKKFVLPTCSPSKPPYRNTQSIQCFNFPTITSNPFSSPLRATYSYLLGIHRRTMQGSVDTGTKRLRKKLLRQNVYWTKRLRDKTSRGQNIYGTKGLLGQNVFGTKGLLGQNVYWTKGLKLKKV